MLDLSRRKFVIGAGLAAATVLQPKMLRAMAPSRFKVAVISDEISPDFDHACSVIANDFGLSWVELRTIWGKNLQSLTAAELAEAQNILTKYKLQVTDIASPLFKVDWPDAPKSQYSSKNDSFGAAESFKKQEEVLKKCIDQAKLFKTDKIRCFDFWRLDDVAPHRAAINAKLREAADVCGKHGLLLVLENEFECNTATAFEAAATLAAVPSEHLALNWDPANAVMRGELDAFPVGFGLLPKHRIRHCHVKNAVKVTEEKIAWAPTALGYIDWKAQFAALSDMGYSDAVSLETHWKSGGSSEESTRASWAGMRTALKTSGNL